MKTSSTVPVGHKRSMHRVGSVVGVLTLLVVRCVVHGQTPAPSGTVLTIAGTGTVNYSGDGGAATNAALTDPNGGALGPDGTFYFADGGNFRIRAINPVTGIITTIAGDGTRADGGDGGPATNAQIGAVSKIAVDAARHILYIADGENICVRQVNLTNGIISKFAGQGINGMGFDGDGGPAVDAKFMFLFGIAVDRAGNVFIADTSNYRIRKVDISTGIINTVAGTGDPMFHPCSIAGDGGPATAAYFNSPLRVTVDGAGNLFIYDEGGGCGNTNFPALVRRVDAGTGIITTVLGGGTNSLGDGVATDMNLVGAQDIAINEAGTALFISAGPPPPNDPYGNQIYKLDVPTGQLTRVAGTVTHGFSGDGGPALDAQFSRITALTLAPGGGLAVSDSFANERIRYVVPDSISLTDGNQTHFYLPWVSALSGDLVIAGNTNLTSLIAGSLTLVGGTINVNGNRSVGSIDIGSLLSAGTVSISTNTSATNINVGSVTSVTGSVAINNNTSAGTVNLSSLTNVNGALNVNGNSALGSVDLGALTSVGSVSISSDTSATNINVGSVTSVTGSVAIDNNTSAGTVDLSSLTNVDGALSVSGNSTLGSVDLGGLTSVGSVSISNNPSAGSVDLGSLMSIDGDLTIISNSASVVVDLNSLTNFGGGSNEATFTLSGGTCEITNGLTIETNGTLAGSSTLDGSVTNEGTISPGASPGQFGITHNLLLKAPSRLRMQLGGYAMSEVDRVDVVGNVTLGGTLSISLIKNFPNQMTNGASFTLLTAGAPLAGAFANVPSGGLLTTTDGYARFVVRYAGQSMVQLTDGVVVDTDLDGLPDWWEDQFGLIKTNAADAALDSDGDGAANRDEFLAGSNPTNAASFFHVTGISPHPGGMLVTWSSVGGKSYRLQMNEPSADGSVTNNFTDFSPLITASGAGEATTNFLAPVDALNGRARYFRVRLGP